MTEKLPEKTKIKTEQIADLKEEEQEKSKIPSLDELPSDWVIFSAHAFYQVLNDNTFKTTLPRLAEQALKKELERVVARSSAHTVIFDSYKTNPYVVDAMTPESFEEFRKWLQGQVFTQKILPRYIEPVITAKMFKDRVWYFISLYTETGTLTPEKEITTLPIKYEILEADPEVKKRASLVISGALEGIVQ